MKKPTIYELARLNRENGGRYFSRENMKAMGQTLRDFKVHATGYKGVWRLEANATPIARLGFHRMKHTSVTHICDKTGKTGYNLEQFAESLLTPDKPVRLDAFDVFEDGKKIDTIFYTHGLYTADEVRVSLIDRGEQSPHILVKMQ